MIKYCTNIKCHDGFGSQYQKILQTYIFCKIHNLNFVYEPLEFVEHNYDNDIEYNNKLEKLMNLKNNISNLTNDISIERLDYMTKVMPFFENNIDKCCKSEHMDFIKKCFWGNKDKSSNFFNNNKFNVAIHIRRENHIDKGLAAGRVTTPNSYYLNIMNIIREKYKDKEILFHIYSQGDLLNFRDFTNSDVYFHINDDIIDNFICMVAADILVISPSSLSYVAALISDGEIYYKKFWHNPKKDWILN
jgi:hypothetical protein